MNTALIMAGGVGERTNQDIPKQFLNVYDKPIIIYTLEAFQNHPDIDNIVVSCLDGWHEILWAYSKQFGISKLSRVVAGGENGQASARNGIYALENECKHDDIIIIHDAIRPLVSADIISDCIVKCRAHGSGLAAMRCQETIVRSIDGQKGNTGINRWEIMRVQTPQAYRYDKLLWAHREAPNLGINDAVYTNTIMLDLGETVYFSLGSDKNLKITSLEDVEMFRALYGAKKAEWMK
jgi:2-C-methyl-D-erythritol 4-phosphate cytidylyltransferase